MKYECEVIQDLLPLYVDGICSGKSREMVDEHLEECSGCTDVKRKLENTEILTDLEQEKEQVLAEHARKEKKHTTVVGMVTAGVLMIPLIVCLICNLAIGHELDWFFIVLTSIMVLASVTVVPLLVRNHKFLWSFGAFAVSLAALLGIICLFTHGNWFWVSVVPSVSGLFIFFMPYFIRKIKLPTALQNHKALLAMFGETIAVFAVIFAVGMYAEADGYWGVSLPITAFGMLLPWGVVLIARYVPFRKMYKASLISLFCGSFCAFVNDIVDMALGETTVPNLAYVDFLHWNQTSNDGNVALLCLAASIVLAVIFWRIGRAEKSLTKK